jgi:rhodanese-related sulfurtransferase
MVSWKDVLDLHLQMCGERRNAMRRGLTMAAALVLLLIVSTTALILAGTPLTEVTVEQARTLIQARAGKGGLAILDVRTPAEFAEGHLAGAANLDVSAADFAARVATLDRAKTYLVYCRTGNRSRKTVQAMERLGFQSIFHMHQGIVGWQQKGYPVSRSS